MRTKHSLLNRKKMWKYFLYLCLALMFISEYTYSCTSVSIVYLEVACSYFRGTHRNTKSRHRIKIDTKENKDEKMSLMFFYSYSPSFGFKLETIMQMDSSRKPCM